MIETKDMTWRAILMGFIRKLFGKKQIKPTSGSQVGEIEEGEGCV